MSTRRQVPLDRLEEYLAGWERLRHMAASIGVKAWLFRAADREDQFLEFLEFGADSGALEDPGVAAARASLDEAFGPSHVEEWRQAL